MSWVELEDSFAFLIYRTARTMRVDFLRAAAAHGFDLTPEQWFVLNKLRHQPGQSQVELSNHIFADRPNMTRILGTLERRGLVRRSPDPEDGRRLQVFLTSRGRSLHDGFNEVVQNERESLFEGLGDRDLATLKRIVGVLERNARD